MAIVMVLVALACVLANPTTAKAADNAPTEAEISELQQQVESSAKEYNEASAHVDQLNTQIRDNQAVIDQVSKTLDDQREKCGKAMKRMYIMQQEGYSLTDMLLSSQSLDDFLQNAEYLDRVQSQSAAEIEEYANMKSSGERAQVDLLSAQVQAEEEKTRASEALEAAKTARQEAQDRAAKAAAEQAAELADAGVIDNNVDWTVGREAFIAEWGTRIDAYLSGSPLAGQGAVFAQAAWDYGIDPRWSPAISNTESSKGLHCFLPHNAWGWGQESWGSWEEAIRAHVAGLARGYGYTITVGAAQKYCPPNYAMWYTNTLAQMQSI